MQNSRLWHKISINNFEAEIAQMSVVAMMEKLVKAYCDAGAPPDFELWHLRMSSADHIYYLSPKGSELSLHLLSDYRVKACPEKPNLKGLERVTL